MKRPHLVICIPFLVGFVAACTQRAEMPAEEPAAKPAEAETAEAPEPSEPEPSEPEPKAGDGEGKMGAISEEAFEKLHELKADEAPPLNGAMVQVEGADAYLSLPPDATGPVPGVVVIHEWWGLNAHIKHWTDRLAALGYAAIAPDLYGGEVATTPDAAAKLMKAVDQDAATQILKGAHAYLRGDERVKAPKVASVGWCFGGGQSLRLAIADPKLDAAVVYYGFPVLEAERLDDIEADLLLIYANEDQSIPPDQVQKLASLLDEVEVTYSLHQYDAHHAFANPSGAHYSPQAAEDAWQKVKAFLQEQLGS